MTLTLHEVEGHPGPVFLTLEDAQAFRDAQPPIGQARIAVREYDVGTTYHGMTATGHDLCPTNTVIWLG